MSRHRSIHPARPSIDVPKALELFARLGAWRRVAEEMKAAGAAPYTSGALAKAAHDWRKRHGEPRLLYMEARENNSLGAWWRPPLPKPWKVVPCYRTDTLSGGKHV
jgi:hypothetical protein